MRVLYFLFFQESLLKTVAIQMLYYSPLSWNPFLMFIFISEWKSRT